MLHCPFEHCKVCAGASHLGGNHSVVHGYLLRVSFPRPVNYTGIDNRVLLFPCGANAQDLARVARGLQYVSRALTGHTLGLSLMT